MPAASNVLRFKRKSSLTTSLIVSAAVLRRRLIMKWRRLRHSLRHVDPTAFIGAGVWIAGRLAMAEFSLVNARCMIGTDLSIGRYAMLGPEVKVFGSDHSYDQAGVPIAFTGRPPVREVVIEDDAWVGCGCTLLAGVRIGRGAIVAAGSVVTKDVGPFEIHGGVPARFIKNRFENPMDVADHIRMLDGPVAAPNYCPPLRFSERKQASPQRRAA